MPGIGIKLTGQWGRARRVLNGFKGSKIGEAMQKAVRQEAQAFRKELVRGIRQQAPGGKRFKPLRPFTLRVRRAQGFRGRKALMRTGEMWRSISVIDTSKGSFVGIKRQARGKDGRSLVNIAILMEEGGPNTVVFVTPKMRAFFRGALGVNLKASTTAIVFKIPARPFFQPVFEKLSKPVSKVRERFLKRVAANMGGEMGRALLPPG